jgi:hypothetical protein
VRSFDEYALVWLGDSYDVDGDGKLDDLRVARTSVGRPFYNPVTGELLLPEIRTFSLGYGNCERPKGTSSCPIPLTMVFSAPCDNLSLPPVSTSRRVPLRGIDAIVQHNGAVRLETADFTVTISPVADSYSGTAEKALRIAGDLVPANAKAKSVLTGTDFRTRPADLCDGATRAIPSASDAR